MDRVAVVKQLLGLAKELVSQGPSEKRADIAPQEKIELIKFIGMQLRSKINTFIQSRMKKNGTGKLFIPFYGTYLILSFNEGGTITIECQRWLARWEEQFKRSIAGIDLVDKESAVRMAANLLAVFDMVLAKFREDNPQE